MTKIDLFPHNEEAYASMIDSLQDSHFSFIERATGTGKSYILIKYIDNIMAGKRVLFVTLHDAMFKQLTERDMPALGTSKNICEKLDCVLYSSIPKHTAEWYVNNYDCIIFDEAHHCGAPIWSQTISEIRDLIAASDDKVMIGATATGTRYLDDYMDVAKEFFDGNVASKLYLSEAILREILPAPFYINFNRASIELISTVEKKLKRLSAYKELDSLREQVSEYKKEIEQKTDIGTLLKKYGVKQGEKYIVFCSSIADLQQKKEEAKRWFKDIGPIETYEAHSDQSGTVNQSQIDAFESNNNSNIKLMFAVDMFNEGLHIKGVDGILMTRKTSSPIVYLQQLGRVLSFSVRKKQVKVFDIAGNALEIDVIYNLYKELLSIAKDNIREGKGNLKHYQEIIERFKIVDEGTILVDKLEDINKFLDDSYLNRVKVSRYLAIMTTYLENAKEDFMTMLRLGKVDREHLRIYKELQGLVDILTYEDFIKLNELGIILSNIQTNDEILEKIKISGNFKAVKDLELEKFFKKYFEFFKEHGRRPSIHNNQEKEMATKYRELLATIKPKKLSKYLKESPYPLNVEELLVLKDYPSKDDLNDYMDMIEAKYEKGISLDLLEQKAIATINQIMSLKNRPIIKNLTSNIVLKMDEHIKVIKLYLESHPEETFFDIKKFKEDKDISKALEFLYRNAEYVTNYQFEILIDLGIKLPPLIDMTLEERKERLEGFDSFFDKEESQNKATVKLIRKFISENKRRPNPENIYERELANFYNRMIYKKGNRWSNIIIDGLLDNEIELTIDEKIIGGYPLTNEDITYIYEDFLMKLRICDKSTFNVNLLRKYLNILKSSKVIDDKLYRIYYRTISVIDYVFSANPRVYKDRIKSYLYNNQSLVPFGILPYLLTTFGISLVNVNRYLRYDKEAINIADKKYQEMIKAKTNYLEYIKKHGKRPRVGSVEHNGIREYLSRSSKHDVLLYIDELNQMGIPLALEELFLVGKLSPKKEQYLYQKIEQKRKHQFTLDELDNKIYKTLYYRLLLDGDTYVKPSNFIKEIEDDMKKDIISEIKAKIDEDPNAPIDYMGYQIPETTKKEIEEYRLLALSKMFIENLIDMMNKKKAPYSNILDEEGIILLNDIIKVLRKYKTNLELVDKLMRLNRGIILKINGIDVELFMSEYVSYVMLNGIVPEDNLADPIAVVLATKYDIIKDVMFIEEKTHFHNMIKRSIENIKKKDFYELFIEFITANQRFPSPLGETEEEIKLAEDYKRLGSKITGDQKRTISKLLKQYQANTIKYAQSRRNNNGNKL